MSRMLLGTSLIVLCHGAPAIADLESKAEIHKPSTLQKQLHRCVRNAFSVQPLTMSKAAAQRAALRECKAAEDAYLAALLSAQARDDATRREGRRGPSLMRQSLGGIGRVLGCNPSSWLPSLIR